MKTKTKIILTLFTATLLILSILSGTALYYYFHPAAIKSFLEKSLPMPLDASLTINDLSYSIDPLRIQAKGIVLKPLDESQDYSLKIDYLAADLCLEGRFGHKSLIVQSLKVSGISSHISQGAVLGAGNYKPKGFSYLAETAKRLFCLLFFRDVEVRRVEFTDGNIIAKSKNGLAEIIGINANMNDDRQIEISCGIFIDLPSEKTGFTAHKISFITDHAVTFIDPEIRCTVKAQEATFRSPDADVKDLELKATLVYKHKNKNLAFESVDLHLHGATLKLNGGESSPLDIDIAAGIIFDLLKNRVNVPVFNMSLEDILLLKAGGNGFFGPQPSIEIDVTECSISPQELRHIIPFRQEEILDPISLSGKVSLKGVVQGNKAGKKWGWHLNLTADLDDNHFSYADKGLRLNSRIFGNIQAEGQFPDLKISAGIKGNDTILSTEGIELKPFNTGLSLSCKHPEYQVEDFSVHIPQSVISLGNKRYPVNDIKMYLKQGTFNANDGSFLIPGIEINSSLLKNLTLSVESEGKNTAIQLQGEDIHLMQSTLALGLIPYGWQLKGVDRIKIKGFEKQKGTWEFSSELNFKEYGFQNQDSSCLAENLSATLKATGEINIPKLRLTANTFLDIDEGEILYDVFYFDLSKNPFLSSCKAEYDISEKSLQFSKAGLGLKDILNIETHGSILQRPEGQHISLSISVPETNLKPAFEIFVLEPFKTEKPFLNAVNIGGAISADLKLTKNKTELEVIGHCFLRDAHFSSGSNGMALNGIDLDLPFWYHNRQEMHGSSLQNGKLNVETITLPWLPEQSLSLTLEADCNTLRVKSPTTIRIPGGEVQIGPVICNDIFGSQLSLLTDLEMNSIDIKPLLSKLWPRPVEGTISGRLDTIHFKGNTVKSNGRISAKCFDGEIIFSDIVASGIFSSAPVFKLNSQWDGLSLSELTTDTPFGRIEGILKGHVKDLQIAYGQPQGFDLLVETVRKKGVAQRISVTAIDNIAGIGGGQSPFIGAAGAFTYFFKRFPYNKIGIHSSLENDVFRINGTITEGGKEYLMKRGGLSGVNIVNQNPDNCISLKDMIKRIKRVGAGHGEGVVK